MLFGYGRTSGELAGWCGLLKTNASFFFGTVLHVVQAHDMVRTISRATPAPSTNGGNGAHGIHVRAYTLYFILSIISGPCFYRFLGMPFGYGCTSVCGLDSSQAGLLAQN